MTWYEWRNGRIVERYAQGDSTGQLAMDFDLTEKYIRRLLRQAGVEIRPETQKGENRHEHSE